MPKGRYNRCQVHEFDMFMSCRKKAVDASWIDEAIRDEYGAVRDSYRRPIPLCQSHYDWIDRPRGQYDLSFDEWRLHNGYVSV